jgi:pSer/pThr/pTyr-binding forkhead associated (FHA) protein
LSPQQFNRILQLLDLESPLGSAPRRPTQKLEPDYQLPHVSALIALGHDFSVPIIRLQNLESLRVGRDDDNDMIIRHPAVSRHHAQLLRQGDSWLVRDLDSDNGTYVSPTGHTCDEHSVNAAPQMLINRAVVRFGPAAYIVSL